MAVDARFRREWRKKNPILDKNVMGIDLNDNSVKLGDGSTRWNDLPYTSSLSGSAPTGSAPGGVSSSELASAVAGLNTTIATKQASSTAATDPELSAAVASLNALITPKQDAATAATDSELSAAIANLTALITPKQDAASAATDAELAAQVTTLTALINAKQDNATAATDAELATAIADVNTSIAAKQDAATAATDSELAQAVSTLNATLLTKQDANLAATDAEVAALLAGKQDVVGNPGSVVSSAPFSAAYNLTVGWGVVPGWQIVVPANSGPVTVGIIEGLLINIITGTNPANTRFTLQGRITDELGAVVAFAMRAVNSSAATTQTWTDLLQLKRFIPNNPAEKTYKVELLMDKVGSAASTSTLFTSAQGFSDPTLAAIRG